VTAPIMQIRHDTSDTWWVAAKWPDGRIEDIKGFSSEADANEWIANELNKWLENRPPEEAKSK
jgi:hypothetical protein